VSKNFHEYKNVLNLNVFMKTAINILGKSVVFHLAVQYCYML
jgi:hypothetical protein